MAPVPFLIPTMTNRNDLIRRKNEIVAARGVIQQRLNAARQTSTSLALIPQLEAELSRLQSEEQRLRLAIDRTRPTPASEPKPASVQQTKFDVFITAGYDRNKPDPLAAVTGEPQKALVNIAGAPMLWHVVRALEESGLVGEIVIVGLDAEHRMDFGRPVHYLDDQGGMWTNQQAAVQFLAELGSRSRYIMATSVDIPLLTGEMVRHFIEACRPFDKEIYWGIVTQQTMETTFPQSKRSYLRLSEGRFCSGDLFLAQLEAGMRLHRHVEPFFITRKSVFQQLRLLGLRMIFAYLFGQLRLPILKEFCEQRFQITAQEVVLPFAEVGMDIDKPHQLEQVLEYLHRHPAHPIHTRLFSGNTDE